ncbi:AMP-binding protein [Streptomyces sp. M10(2022)]
MPLDPAYPVERLEFMLSDALPVCLVTDRAEAPRVGRAPAGPGGERRGRRARALDGTDVRDEERPASLTARSAAYVIYTSGSTGRPKGVVIEHDALLRYVTWAADSYPGGRVSALLHSSLSFDLTVTALFLPLLHGGRIHHAALADDVEARAALAKVPLGFLSAPRATWLC